MVLNNMKDIEAAVKYLMSRPPRSERRRKPKRKRDVAVRGPSGGVKTPKKTASNTSFDQSALYKPTVKMVRKRAVGIHKAELKELKKKLRLLKPEQSDLRIQYEGRCSAIADHLKDLAKARSAFGGKGRVKKVKADVRKRKASGAGMDRDARHHTRKYYISPDQRWINKVEDGVIVLDKPKPTLQLVGAAPVVEEVFLCVPVKGDVPISRKERRKAEYLANAKPKYSVYTARAKGQVLRAA